MGHRMTCLIPGCGWMQEHQQQPVADAAAVWHVYREHPEQWRQVAGDKTPTDPAPETFLYVPSAN
jgi:hypothetical protein